MAGEIQQSVYENVTDLITKATEQYGETVALNRDAIQKLPGVCELIEMFLKHFDCEYYEVNVLADTMQLMIAVVCDEVIFDKQNSSNFYKLIGMTDGFSFIRYGSESLRIEFEINHIWRTL